MMTIHPCWKLKVTNDPTQLITSWSFRLKLYGFHVGLGGALSRSNSSIHPPASETETLK